MVKNESKVSGVVDDYKKKREALEDLADSWISSLKKDKQPKRKQVTVKAKKGDERAVKRWGAGKSKQDVMEYKLWELEEAYRDAKEEGRRAEGMVRTPQRPRGGCLACVLAAAGVSRGRVCRSRRRRS